jgi:hypothetical protein
VPIAQICRLVADSDVVVGHGFCNREKQQLEIGVDGVGRFGASVCGSAELTLGSG